MKNESCIKQKRFHYSMNEKRKFPFIIITLAIPLAHLLVFWVYVHFEAILLAFKDTTNPELMNNWPLSFASFQKVIEEIISGSTQNGQRNLIVMLGKSVLLWTNLHVISNIISLVTCFILTKHMIGSRLFRTIYYIPGIVGAVVFSTIMKELYMADGVVTNLMVSLGVDLPVGAERGGLLSDVSTAFMTLFSQQFILGIAGGSMIIAGAYKRIPNEVFESASLDGCGFFGQAIKIAIPCAWPTISTLMVFSLCSIFICDINLYLYSPEGSYGLESMGFFMYTLRVGLSNNPYNSWLYGYSSALGILLTIITIPVVYLGKWILNKVSDNVEF